MMHVELKEREYEISGKWPIHSLPHSILARFRALAGKETIRFGRGIETDIVNPNPCVHSWGQQHGTVEVSSNISLCFSGPNLMSNSPV